MKRVLQTILCIILSAAVGTALIMISTQIPSDNVALHVRNSAIHTISQEGLYPEITHVATSYLDNWTDSIMLGNAAYPSSDDPIRSSMLIPRYMSGENPVEALVNWATDGSYTYVEEYPQYWHGYLVLLKPLLLLFEYREIRILNGIVQTFFTLLVAVLLWRRNQSKYIVPWLMSIGMMMPVALAKSMQYSSCFYIFTIMSIVMLQLKSNRKNWLLFLFGGIATAFFDFLTYPISTFGIPILIWLILYNELKAAEKCRTFLMMLMTWGLGYGFMWAGKLIIGSLLTGRNLFGAAGSHVFHWFDGDRWYTPGYVLYFNIRDFVYTPVSVMAMGFAMYTLITSVRILKIKEATLSETAVVALPFLLIAILPFAWYMFLFNPSGMHHFFTNKACVVTIFSLLSMLVAIKNFDYSGGRTCVSIDNSM